jgi:hypothetical protein
LDVAAAEAVEEVAGALDGRSLLPVGHGEDSCRRSSARAARTP